MSTKTSIFIVTLHRDGISSPWGFRMAGGCDLDSPLVITKVALGTPSQGELKPGDIVRKIGDYDARDLRHKDALNLFQNAGSSITLVVQRDVPNDESSNGRCSNAIPALLNPPVAGGVATPFTVAGLPAYERTIQSPINNLTRFPPKLIEPNGYDRTPTNSPHTIEVQNETRAIYDQPYRTNPLVLPGAKANKDLPSTISYLRHHPNPAMRSTPAHYEWVPEEIVRKQKVADSVLQKTFGNDLSSGKKVVLKQFNSPIGLYSEQNIASSVQSQTGLTPLRKTVVFDPSKSETYKVLQESQYENGVHEVNKPATPRVFSPPKKFPASTYNPNRASPQPHPTAPHQSANYGVPTDEIHQSNSFKRLRNMLLN